MEKIKENQSISTELRAKNPGGISLTIYPGGKKRNKRKSISFINKVKIEEEHSQIPTTYELFSDTMDVGFRTKKANLSTKENEPPITGGGDGGNGMEKRLDRLEQRTEQIQNKVHEVDVKLAGIEETQKNALTKSEFLEAIAKLPKEDNIKQIFSSTLDEKKLASELYVETVIVKNVNKLILWLIGTAIGTGALVVGILRFMN